jgi:diaminopropionate ammonia-lyase
MVTVKNPMRLAGAWPPAPLEPYAFHRRLPNYASTPLHDFDGSPFNAGRLLVKDESCRLGLPAFKGLGAWWAVIRALSHRLSDRGYLLRRTRVDELEWADLDELASLFAPLGPLTLAAATDGNHGRAVARVAKTLGLDALIWVPAGTAEARIDAIAREGATVRVSDGGYDRAVRDASAAAGETTLVISDTSAGGWDRRIPQWVIDGYSTIFREIDEQLADLGIAHVDAVVVPIGVGALAAAAATHYRCSNRLASPALIGVEPIGAASMSASVLAGRLVSLDDVERSAMVGLNCGTPSSVAWPMVSRGFDEFVTITDEEAKSAVRAFAGLGLRTGESGAAALAGWRQLSSDLRPRAENVLLLSTEGATDPASYAQVLAGATPASIGAPS